MQGIRTVDRAFERVLTEPEDRMGQATVTVTDQNWEELVAKGDKPVLVDFWADWCGPCHMVAPTIEEIASEEASRLVVGKLNVDENPEAARRYGVMSIPSMLLFVDGVEKARVVGARGKAAILSELEPHLG
jgi:thioredoxin 1